MTMPASDFVDVMDACEKVFRKWESDYQEFREILRRN